MPRHLTPGGAQPGIVGASSDTWDEVEQIRGAERAQRAQMGDGQRKAEHQTINSAQCTGGQQGKT